MLKNTLNNYVNAILTESSLKEVVLDAIDTIFEGNYWNPKIPRVNATQMMGDYNNIMKQVGIGVIGGGGAMVDRSNMNYVENKPSHSRDIAEETKTQWGELKMGKPPIKARSHKFIDKAIKMANETHLPVNREIDIASSQRRFAAIYPALNTGINTSLPPLR